MLEELFLVFSYPLGIFRHLPTCKFEVRNIWWRTVRDVPTVRPVVIAYVVCVSLYRCSSFCAVLSDPLSLFHYTFQQVESLFFPGTKCLVSSPHVPPQLISNSFPVIFFFYCLNGNNILHQLPVTGLNHLKRFFTLETNQTLVQFDPDWEHLFWMIKTLVSGTFHFFLWKIK